MKRVSPPKLPISTTITSSARPSHPSTLCHRGDMRLPKVAERQVSWKHPAASSCLMPGMLMTPHAKCHFLVCLLRQVSFQLTECSLFRGKSNKPPVSSSCPLPGLQLSPGIVLPVIAWHPSLWGSALSSSSPSISSCFTPQQQSCLLWRRENSSQPQMPHPAGTFECEAMLVSHPCKGVGNTFSQVGLSPAFPPQLILFNMFPLWSGADLTFPSSM